MDAVQSKKILVRSVEFGRPAFRKLSSFKIDISERITIIAGHNGIGKSTILGLLANTFGMTRKNGPRNYFGDPFFANIEKIVYLALDEVEYAKKEVTSAPLVSASVGDIVVTKRCALTQRTEWNRARVVPRTVEKADDDPVGQDAKVPLPTIYLGIRRLASIGEADEYEVSSAQLKMHESDRQLMVDFVGSVIQGSQINDQVTENQIKGLRKRAVQPGYSNHDALAISMGQDSLGSIATAFASFNRLKRDQGDNYVGGLLVIDELDVGFHPHAIEKLAQALKKYAKKLALQIVATTHSPRLIEAIHPDGDGQNLAPDSVVYLLDTRTPRIAEDQSLKAILDDMALRHELPQRAAKPVLGVYFEDAEGEQLFNALVPAAKKAALSRKYGVRIKPIGLGVGGSNLLGLPDRDPVFKSRILIVDGDTSIPAKARKRGNALKFPFTAGATGTARSPENMIINFIKSMIAARDGNLYAAMLELNTTNPSSDKLTSVFFPNGLDISTDRAATKKWWVKNWDTISSWKIIESWRACNQAQVDAFLQELEDAVKRTSTLLR